MNKKGFAISVILYSMVILLIGILYLLLGIIKNRYMIGERLKKDVMNSINFLQTGDDPSCFTYERIKADQYYAYYYNGTIRYYTLNINNVNVCKDYLLLLMGSDISDDNDGYDSYCRGTGTIENLTFQNHIESNAFNNTNIDYLVDSGYLVLESNPQFIGIKLTGYNEVTCGKNVIIPAMINNLPVTTIADSNGGGVFANKDLTNVLIPKTVTYIGYNAFSDNSLESVIIQEDAIINELAFYQNATKINLFQYNGTCAKLNSYQNIFLSSPRRIITSDNSNCIYNNYRWAG